MCYGNHICEMFEKISPLSSEKLNTFSLKKVKGIVKEINQTPSLYLEAGAIHGSVHVIEKVCWHIWKM